MTCPRRVVPGTTYLLTRRCTQRRFMLVPRGLVPALFGYCIALAAKRHGILVHAVMVMSNHLCMEDRLSLGCVGSDVEPGIIEPNFGH